jgi:hypothetical protein
VKIIKRILGVMNEITVGMKERPATDSPNEGSPGRREGTRPISNILVNAENNGHVESNLNRGSDKFGSDKFGIRLFLKLH